MSGDKRWDEFNTIIDSEELEMKEKCLLLIIFRYVNFKTGYATPSRSLIKKLTGIKHNHTLDKYFNSLISKGFLYRESGKGIRSKYYVKVRPKNEPSSIIIPSAENESIVGAKIEPTVGAKIELQKENKRKEKEKIYIHWNSKNIIVHKSLSKVIEKAIDFALETYSENEIIAAIDTYDEILKSDFYFSHKWSLSEFLTKTNSISTFMNEGKNKKYYDEYLLKKNKTEIIKKSKPKKLRGWDN